MVHALSPRVIINADDFGLSSPVNIAIAMAHREGVLTSASLMVGQSATAEAVDIARQNSRLAVGLHITLSDAVPVLASEQIPDLVQPDGRFWPDEARLYRSLYLARIRRQVEAEVAAQLKAFRTTGLDCDHVNTHRNVHLQPIIGKLVPIGTASRHLRHAYSLLSARSGESATPACPIFTGDRRATVGTVL
jgi:predicted glycoside hydrolase/deacetylase ChbG (UPF0249 family)